MCLTRWLSSRIGSTVCLSLALVFICACLRVCGAGQEPRTFNEVTTELEQLLRAFGVGPRDPLVLVGYSAGALACRHLALRRTDEGDPAWLVGGLVLVEGSHEAMLDLPEASTFWPAFPVHDVVHVCNTQ